MTGNKVMFGLVACLVVAILWVGGMISFGEDECNTKGLAKWLVEGRSSLERDERFYGAQEFCRWVPDVSVERIVYTFDATDVGESNTTLTGSAWVSAYLGGGVDLMADVLYIFSFDTTPLLGDAEIVGGNLTITKVRGKE